MINFLRITTLALADSINPCEIAILAMVLMTIMIQNPDKKRKVLLGGLAFVSAVFIGYFAYGVIIVQLFKTLNEAILNISPYIYKGFAIIAMILGALNIKDFLYYKKGSLATEMPLFLRPKAKRIIDKITSPKGAFFLGFFITLFLLPCTMGPYVVASGLLADLGILGAMPWLIYYNIIFVLPMLIITLIIYLGFAKVDEVTGWKDRNVKILHLISGILLFLVGVAILAGWL
ncbi:hypothetical protein HYT23_06185 [Candidatus Pacearchaeota archaeon]|nr:hypothetical protein [Candidatus Pacearchaeota archaeon]